MNSIKAHRDFSEGDAVVLAEGTYQGTVGTFLRLREDVKWADISEQNGSIRSHPVAWLALSPQSRAGGRPEQFLPTNSAPPALDRDE